MDPAPATAWLTLIAVSLTVIGGVLGGIAAIWHWLIEPRVERMVRRVVVEYTAQIQPEANGGKSLSDVHVELGRIKEVAERVAKEHDAEEQSTSVRFRIVHERVDDHLTWHAQRA